MRLVLLLAWAAAQTPAQTLQLFSEFQRVDPFGEILAIDRSPDPREIISPAVARNGYASFHIAVTAPAGTNYFLFVQSNPPDILETRLYKEQFFRVGDTWIPDAMEETRSPCFGVIPDAQADIPGQTTRDYLLDIRVPADAEIGRRVRVEVLLKVGTWLIAPMELRITAAQVPVVSTNSIGTLPGIAEPADSAAVYALASYLSGAGAEWSGDSPGTVRQVLRRNAQQDMALARADPAPEIWLRAASQIVNGWTLFPNGAEWYLRVRDLLISRRRP